MTYDDLQSAWNSPHNQPHPEEFERQKKRLIQRLRRQHRGFVAMIGLATFWMLAFGTMFARRGLHGMAFDPVREWGAPLLFLLPLAALALLWSRFFVHRSRHVGHADSIRASVAALLDENRLARFRTKLIAVLNILVLVVVPVCIDQLRASGKAGDEILVPGFVVFPAIMLTVLAAMSLHYRRKLLPEKAELEALLRSYE
jgi:hypothetical protein